MTANATIRFLARFCREHPLDDKVFLCPSFVVGRQVGESLAREAGSWVNLRFVTPWTLAGEVLERSGRSGRGRPMTAAAELALVDRLFRELCDGDGKLTYFGDRPAAPGLVDALHRAIRDLRLAGLTGADLRPGLFLVEDKGREIARLVERYEHDLEEKELLDAAAFLSSAARAAGQGSFAPAWTLCPADARLSRLERDLVRAAAGDRLVIVPGDPVFGLARPRACWPSPGEGEVSKAERLSWLFAPGKAAGGGEDPRIEIFRALGPANECREVLRRLYSEKTAFDRAEVLVPAGAAHATVFYLLSARTRLPVTFGDGIPVSFTSPGRLFFGLLDWLRNDFSSAYLCRLLENGDLVLAPGPSGTPLAARTACRHLRSAMIGWKRERYLACLRALREARAADLTRVDKGAGEDGAEVDEVRRGSLSAALAEIDDLSAGVRRLLAAFPDPDENNEYDIQALCAAFAALLGDHGRPETDFDRSAGEVLRGRLSEIREEGRRPALALNEALDLLRTMGASLRVGASPPLPGHLHVSGFSTGGHSGRPVTFVLGLDEATFPGRGLQDPVLLDEERAALSDALPTSADGLLSRLFGLASALASVRGRVVFSYPSFDVVEGRESFPSSVVLQAFRLQRGAPGLDYGALEREIADAAGFLPGGVDRSFDEVDWWLERLAGGDPVRDGAGSIPANFPDLAAGLAAAAARAGDTLTEFDGIVDIGPLREEVDPLSGDKAVMSASRLELLARCPFAYFLRHVLKVEAPEEVAFDRARWLDPLRRGSLIHAILCDFMTRVRDRGETVAAGRHAGLMEGIAASALARTKEEIPPPSEAVFESETKDIRDSLSIFLAAEENLEEKGEPIAFEMEIAKRRIELDRDRSFLLRGYIDRVDRLGRDTYRILDYKTGSASDYEELVEFGGGQKIQHALYAVALEKILSERPGGGTPRVTRSGYLFPSRRGEGLARIIKDFDRDRLKSLLVDLLALLQNGYFIAGPDAKCTYCDYGPVCGAGAPESSGRKREGSPGILEAYDKLGEYK